jgi:hypothetical protein
MVYSSEVGLNILEQNTSNIPRPCKKGILVYGFYKSTID